MKADLPHINWRQARQALKGAGKQARYWSNSDRETPIVDNMWELAKIKPSGNFVLSLDHHKGENKVYSDKIGSARFELSERTCQSPKSRIIC